MFIYKQTSIYYANNKLFTLIENCILPAQILHQNFLNFRHSCTTSHKYHFSDLRLDAPRNTFRNVNINSKFISIMVFSGAPQNKQKFYFNDSFFFHTTIKWIMRLWMRLLLTMDWTVLCALTRVISDSFKASSMGLVTLSNKSCVSSSSSALVTGDLKSFSSNKFSTFQENKGKN